MDKKQHAEIFSKYLMLTKVEPLPNRTLSVEFSRGEYGLVSMVEEIEKKESLSALKDHKFFAKCAIIRDGTSLGWLVISLLTGTLFIISPKSKVY
jgi:hypothetical protein